MNDKKTSFRNNKKLHPNTYLRDNIFACCGDFNVENTAFNKTSKIINIIAPKAGLSETSSYFPLLFIAFVWPQERHKGWRAGHATFCAQ